MWFFISWYSNKCKRFFSKKNQCLANEIKKKKDSINFSISLSLTSIKILNSNLSLWNQFNVSGDILKIVEEIKNKITDEIEEKLNKNGMAFTFIEAQNHINLFFAPLVFFLSKKD